MDFLKVKATDHIAHVTTPKIRQSIAQAAESHCDLAIEQPSGGRVAAAPDSGGAAQILQG